MRKKSNKKLLSRLLVFLMVVALVGTDASVVAAASITPPDGTYVISNTEQRIAPGITESKIVTNKTSGNNQNIDYTCEVDLANTSTTKIIAGYGGYNASSWKMDKLSNQAKAAEKATGLNVVAGINADFFNMSTGEPLGALVMGGKVYHNANGRPYFAIMKDGSAQIREGSQSLDGVQEAVGGDLIIAKGGKVVNCSDDNVYQTQVYTRTAIGIRKDGTVVTFATHGRNYPISCGRSYKEVAQMLVGLGCDTVLNLDGGGSTTYSSKYEGSDEFLTRNNPSDGAERKISSSLLIVSTAKPTGQFDHASLAPNDLVYTPGSSVEFTATGVDSAGGEATIPSGVAWTLQDSSYGTIDSNGKFTSNGKTGEVKVNLMSEGKVVGTTSITIAAPDEISFSSEEVSLGFDKQSDLGLIVKSKGRDVIYKDGDFNWTLSLDPEYEKGYEASDLGSFSGNTFTSSSSKTVNGYATATYKNDESISGKVHLIIGRLPSVVMDFEDKTDADGNVIAAKDYWNFARAAINANGGTIIQLYDTNGNKISSTDATLVTGHYVNDVNNPDNSRGGNESAEIVDIASGEPVRFGNNSLKLNYDFSNINGIEGACVGFSKQSQEIEGNPSAIGMWVYAPEGTPNLWLRIRLLDGANNVLTLNFTEKMTGEAPGQLGGINWTGWKYVEADLTGSKGPFKLLGGETIRVMNTNGAYGGMGWFLPNGTKITNAQCKGSIYIDNLRFVYGANVDDTDSPIIDSIEANNEELKDGQTIDTNKVSFKSMFHDIENKYSTGIDYSTVYIFVDGEDMTKNENYVLQKGDNALYLNDLVLANGKHTVKVLVRDGFGNEATETRSFIVNGQDDLTNVSVEPESEVAPKLNANYNLSLKSNKVEDVKSVSTAIAFGEDFSEFNIKFTDDYEGTYSYDKDSNQVKIEATRKDTATSTGEGAIATITTKIPSDLSKGTKLTYNISKGIIEYASEKEGNVSNTFSGSNSIAVEADYTVKADTLVVGLGGNMYVYDENENPVSGVDIYFENGDKLGTTDEKGAVDASSLCDKVTKYTVYAEKDGKYSFKTTGQSITVAESEDGKPITVLHNANSSSTNTKNISWLSSRADSEAKAILQIAKASDYEANGDSAFKDYTGTSKLFSFTGSAVIEENRVVRINQVTATGFSSGVKYVYRVGDGEKWSDVDSFTLTRKGTATNLFIVGDTQADDITTVQNIVNQLANSGQKYSLGIQTGDLIEKASLYSDWLKGLNIFDGIGSVDMMHVVGNHELFGDTEGDASEALFGLQNKHHYSVQYGNVYVATIGYTESKAQLQADLEWLREDAKASNAKWKILTMHQPPYYTNPNGGNGPINELVPPVAEEVGIDFVFSGHDHSYARTAPLKGGKVDEKDGIVYYICGSTGEKSYSAVDNKDFHFEIVDQDYNAIYLTVSTTDDTFTVQTHESDGSVIDTYTKSKTSEDCTNGHDYVYDGEYIECKKCGHAEKLGNYTGFATEEKSGKKMYFINGKFQTGWIADPNDQYNMYHFGTDGLAHDVVVTEDKPTTCTYRGHKTFKCNDCNLTYTIRYPKNAGHEYEPVITSTGKNEYICKKCGYKSLGLLSKQSIKLSYTTSAYTGNNKIPAVTITTTTGKTLVKNTDFTTSYVDNVNVGTGRVTIIGIGDYAGEVVKTFKITPRNISTMNNTNVTLEYDTVDADGTQKTPEVTKLTGQITYVSGGQNQTKTLSLVKDRDYTVSYSNNVKPGTATVTITGTGNYTGTITKTFEIKGDEVTVDKVTGFKSTGTTTSEIDLAWDKANCDGYEITRYSTASKTYVKIADIDNADTTTYKDTGKASGCYYKYKIKAYKVVNGEKVYSEESDIVKATVKPLAPTAKLETVTKDSASISWNQIAMATGYEVYRADKDSEDYKLVKDIASATTLTYKDAGLDADTAYKYKVKAYRTVDGQKVYSEDSNVVDAKTEQGSSEEVITKQGITTGSLNVRSGPSTAYDKLGYLAKGTTVEIVGKASNGWYKIKYKDGYGYVSNKYVKLGVYEGETTGNVNVRSGSSTTSSKLGYLTKGTKVDVVEVASNGWYKIKYKDGYGYVSYKYVKLNVKAKTTGNLNVRSGSSTTATKIGYLTKGTKVKIVQICSNGWYKIEYKDGYGYISNKYVELD